MVTGLKYLQFLTTCPWFKHAGIVQSIIDDYLEDQDVGDVPELKEETEPKKAKWKKDGAAVESSARNKIIVSHD